MTSELLNKSAHQPLRDCGNKGEYAHSIALGSHPQRFPDVSVHRCSGGSNDPTGMDARESYDLSMSQFLQRPPQNPKQKHVVVCGRLVAVRNHVRLPSN